MKRYGNLWESLVSWDNLVLAARKAQRQKRGRVAIQRFYFDLERELLKLQGELEDSSYRPGQFRSHWIYRPKCRLISAAPYRDRVVHHALMNVLEPILDHHFHYDSYACRKNKGAHAAANRLQSLMRRYKYALQCDIRKYFPSIDHKILKATFRRLIKDNKVLWLMDLIVDYSNEQERVVNWFEGDDLFTPIERPKGLPIGNLTSQWFANWMLNDLDHFITSSLGIGGYVRYCDDFVLLHNDRQVLKEASSEIRQHLAQIRMRLHEHKLSVKPVCAGVTFVGYRIWPTHRLIRKANIRLFRRRVGWMRRAYANRDIDWVDIKIRLDSWIGHARHADSQQLIRRLSREWIFKRDETVNVSCSPRRLLEQQPEELPICKSQQEHAGQPEQQQRVSCCFPALSDRNRMWPGITWFKDHASVALKVLVSFLSHWFSKPMAEFTRYGRMGLVGIVRTSHLVRHTIYCSLLSWFVLRMSLNHGKLCRTFI
jgi:retron-type reverse transcriptase